MHLFRKFEIVAIDTDKNTFLMTILIKMTLGKESEWSPGVSREAKFSTKFEFGSLVR